MFWSIYILYDPNNWILYNICLGIYNLHAHFILKKAPNIHSFETNL